MDVKRWSSLQETFDQLADMGADEQVHALRALSESDPTLAEEVRELLEEDVNAQRLPEMNVESLLLEALHRDDATWPDEGQIGPYSIVKLLGEGGMGVVYLAKRPDIAGYVAIKLLRDAWLSPLRRERFAIEQQMLGLLKHPAIARIYDAGTTKDGTPWFVMEFADGVPITEYFRQRKFTGRELVKLVGIVCETVRYAHSLAIIHRDLKPSNILVTGDGQIKLLDFGIAKQMDLVNRGSTVTTAGFRLFTPAYAAPELQSENKVGVFTDIYSIGVILYQLLTGRLPFPEGNLGDRAPQRPSRVCQAADPANRLALSKSEWADIDAICMKALDRDAESRYGSMDALISDVNAFLDDRPLEARRHAVLYTARKFLYRNRLSVVSVALGLLLVLVGTVLFTVRLARARDAAARARDQAVAEAARTARLEGFTESLFSGGARYGIPPPNIKITEMLERGKSEAVQMTGDPRLQADMFQTLGTAYLSLGHFAEAEPLLRKAQKQICSTNPGLQCADVEIRLGTANGHHGSLDESVAWLEDGLRIEEKILPHNDPNLANVMADVAIARRARGDYAGANAMYDQAFVVASASGRPTPQLAAVLDSYAVGRLPYGDPRAIQYEERSEQMNLQFFGANSFEHADNEFGLGQVYLGDGDYRQAEQHFRIALSELEAWAGIAGERVSRCMTELASALMLEGKLREASEWLHRSLAISAQSGSPATYEIGQANFYLGFIDLQQGDLNGAEKYFDSVVAYSRNHEACDEMIVEYSELSLAHVYSERGDNRRAESAIRQVLATTTLKPSYVIVGGYALLGHVLLQEGRLLEAEAALRPAFAWLSRDATRPHTVMTYKDLAEVERRLGKPQESAKILAALHARTK